MIYIINDIFKPTYRITWTQSKINKEFETFIDSIESQCKIIVNVVEHAKWNSELSLKVFNIERSTSKFQNKGKEYLTLLYNIWSKLLSKSIIELIVQDSIKSKSIY